MPFCVWTDFTLCDYIFERLEILRAGHERLEIFHAGHERLENLHAGHEQFSFSPELRSQLLMLKKEKRIFVSLLFLSFKGVLFE